MNTKYHALPLCTSDNVARIMQNASGGFSCWPQGELSQHLIEWRKLEIESLLDGLYSTYTGELKPRAAELLAEAYGLHPLIRTRWGAITGCTQSGDVLRTDHSWHRVGIHVHRAQQLDTPDLISQFGSGITFNPFAEELCDKLKNIVNAHNLMPCARAIAVHPGMDYCVAEISVPFDRSKSAAESHEAFASLMSFLATVFANGEIEKFIEQSCTDDVLFAAILKLKHSFRSKRQLRKMPVGGLKYWSGKRYGDLPALSDIAAAQAAYESGLHPENWPYVLLPGTITKPWVAYLRAESIKPDNLTQEEADEALETALRLVCEPDPVIRTSWGMLVLERQTHIDEDFHLGQYTVTVHASTAWSCENFDSIAEIAVNLLLHRTKDLCERYPDYPIEVDMEEGTGAGLVTLTCNFDPTAGAAQEAACRESLRNYLFLVLALNILGETLQEACGSESIEREARAY